LETTLLASDTLVQSRYRIIRLLGRGGMGAVYEAIDTRLGSQVALKHTSLAGVEPQQAARLRRAMEREAKILATLRHPVLPTVSDFFDDVGGVCLVMQYIPGDDLATLLIRRGAPFAVDEVLGWADALLGTLNYLHTRKVPVLHRDIKPQNLKLTPGGEIILLDFGLARAYEAFRSIASTGSLVACTPQYAPIEQIRGEPPDVRSDLYALAATLHHLLTGQFPATAYARTLAAIEGRPDPLRLAHELNSRVPPAVSLVLLQALAPLVDQRPPTAAALRTLLRQAHAAAPIPDANVLPVAAPPLIQRAVALVRCAEAHLRALGDDARRTIVLPTLRPRRLALRPPAYQRFSDRPLAALTAGSLSIALAAALALGESHADARHDSTPAPTAQRAVLGGLGDAEMYLQSARNHAAVGDYTNALADAHRAIELRPGFAEAFYVRGLARLRLGMRTLAAQDFQAAARHAADPELRRAAEEQLQLLG
jgi:hypothetical protein